MTARLSPTARQMDRHGPGLDNITIAAGTRPRPPAARRVLRPICRRDLAAVAANLPAAPYRTHADDLESQRTGSVTELVAWDDSAPVGVGFIRWRGPRDPSVAALLPHCPEIFRLEVLTTHRSKGFGTALVHALEALARARGRTLVGLGVAVANHRARLLYERLGYRPANVRHYVDSRHCLGPDGEFYTLEDECMFMTKDLVVATIGGELGSPADELDGVSSRETRA